MRTARLVQNRTTMHVLCVVLDDAEGREQLVTIAKMTWAVSPEGRVSVHTPQRPVRTSSSSHAEDVRSVRLPKDIVANKPGTDVLMVGTLTPPARSTQQQVDVRLVVGDDKRFRVDKRVRVYGARVWQKGVMGVKPGPAAALEPTPLIYENTFGGSDKSDPANPVVDDRNPLGTGVASDSSTLAGTPAPRIEDPDHPLTSRNPKPAGFGALGANWPPRRRYTGTRDQTWLRERAPILPLDFDPRANCVAPEDQRCDPPLIGDESVEVSGMREHVWRFKLPPHRPRFFAKLVDEEELRPLDTHLDTYIIDADEGLVELTWRACVPMPRKSERLRWVRVYGEPPLPDELVQDLAQRALGREDAS